MVKFVKTSPHAAYSVAVGIDAEEAAKLGLAVVESTADGRPSAYGKYDDAPKGGPLGITVDQLADTDVIAGGGVSPNVGTATGGADKGSVLNMDDPFVHGGSGDESIHADNAAPGKTNDQQDQDAAVQAAKEANEKNAAHSKKK